MNNQAMIQVTEQLSNIATFGATMLVASTVGILAGMLIIITLRNK